MEYVLLLFVFSHDGTDHYHQLGKYASAQQCRDAEKPIYAGLIAEGKEADNLHMSCITEDDAAALRATITSSAR